MADAAGEGGIGGRVRAVRERLGLSREALAFHSGISWSAIAQVESGRRTNLRPATLAALARALGVTIDYLVAGGSPSGVMFEHRALLYDDDDEFILTATAYLAEAVDRGEPALAVTDSGKLDTLRGELGADAEHITFACLEDWYTSPISALAAYHRFASETTRDGAHWTRILGEPTWNGRATGDERAWLRYESLLNLVFRGWPVSLLCAYATHACDGAVLEQACATHPHTIEGGVLTQSPTYQDPDSYLLEQLS